jgi:hypothetical protein
MTNIWAQLEEPVLLQLDETRSLPKIVCNVH